VLKTKIASALLICLAFNKATATPIELPLGPITSFGNASIPSSLLTLTQNPAAPAMAHGKKESELYNSYGFGAVGVGVELGDWGTVMDKLDALSTLDPNAIDPAQLNAVVAQVNDAFSTLNQLGYVKSSLNSAVPLFPMIYSSQDMKSVYISADVSAQTKINYLDSPVQVTGVDSISATGALYTKALYRGDISIGYSQHLMDTSIGTLYVGGKVNAISLSLHKNVQGQSIDIANPGATAFTLDPSTFQYQQSLAFGMDVGVLLTSDNLQAGLTLTNLGNPSFSYPVIGQNCSTLPVAEQDSCYIAVAHSDRINLLETHVMTPQLKAEGAMLSSSGNFVVATAMDLNAVNDATGDPVQWFTLSSAYLPQGWSGLAAPEVRLGFRKNLAGSQMGYMNIGMTLFKFLALDIAQSLNTTTINDAGNTTTVPRSLLFSLGFAANF